MTGRTEPLTDWHTTVPKELCTDYSPKCQPRIMVLSGLCQEGQRGGSKRQRMLALIKGIRRVRFLHSPASISASHTCAGIRGSSGDRSSGLLENFSPGDPSNHATSCGIN